MEMQSVAHKITFTDEDINNSGGTGKLTWYIKGIRLNNPKIECKFVDHTNPTFSISVQDGIKATLNGTPIISTLSSEVSVPERVEIKMNGNDCTTLKLWSSPEGNLPVTVSAPEDLILKSDNDQMRAERISEEGKYNLCSNGKAGVYSGTAIIKINQK